MEAGSGERVFGEEVVRDKGVVRVSKNETLGRSRSTLDGKGMSFDGQSICDGEDARSTPEPSC